MALDSERAAWLRLTLTPGVGGASQRSLLKRFGSPAAIYGASRAELARVVPQPVVERLLGEDVDAEIAAALAWADQAGHHLVALSDAEYPQALLEIADPPALLYVLGRPELLNRSAFAIVGSRNATPQGEANAEAFAAALSQAGFTIVSGLALGIDAAAHRGALRGPGSTVAVLGTGIDRVYPPRNRDLARALAEQGALVSEFPLGTKALAGHFPRRNRLIAGLARGVLVAEAALASGSLITARLAAERGADVFALPGSIHSPQSRGCHKLIKEGAKLVDAVTDILDELGAGAPAQPEGAPPRTDDAQGDILDKMGYEPCSMDLLGERLGLTPDTLSAMLLQLELEGRVASLPGGRYQRLL